MGVEVPRARWTTAAGAPVPSAHASASDGTSASGFCSTSRTRCPGLTQLRWLPAFISTLSHTKMHKQQHSYMLPMASSTTHDTWRRARWAVRRQKTTVRAPPDPRPRPRPRSRPRPRPRPDPKRAQPTHDARWRTNGTSRSRGPDSRRGRQLAQFRDENRWHSGSTLLTRRPGGLGHSSGSQSC